MKISMLFGLLLSLSALTFAFNNPIIWEDLADVDIKRVGDAWYYSASTMHYSPGAPILRSYDLFNWEYIGHSVPTLDFGDGYNLAGGSRAYVGGVWASFFGYHPTKKTWYWGGCINFWRSYIYSAPSVTGPWTRLTAIDKCWYDSGLLIDDDGTMYVSYIADSAIWVAQLSSDAKTEVKSQLVFTPPSDIGYLEGSRMYKRNGQYYILVDKPSTAEYTLKASNPFGPYTLKVLVDTIPHPSTSAAGYPHQGGIVDSPSGQWYYMAFVDAYPGGRIPVLAPITWGSDGFPSVQLVNGTWGDSYPNPATPRPAPSLTGVDYFKNSSLGPQWEWNHNPDTTKFSVGNGLVLNTATVTNDFYLARNTLSHRILGPISTATIKLNYANMKDGDRAGLVMLRDQSAWVGVTRDNGAYKLSYVNNLLLNSTTWQSTVSTGATVTSKSISGGNIWLRATADIRPSGSGGTNQVTFSYSTDGKTFSVFGPAFTMNAGWEFFIGYRFGIFNYATIALGGSVTVPFFQLDAGSGSTPASLTSRTSRITAVQPPSEDGGSGCSVTPYAQCGGSAACTACALGSTCKYSSDCKSCCPLAFKPSPLN